MSAPHGRLPPMPPKGFYKRNPDWKVETPPARKSSRSLFLTVLLAGAIGLSGCAPSPWVKLPDQKRVLRVVEVEPPKHLHVSMMDVENGTIYERIYLAKRCSNYQQVPLNSDFPVTMKVWENNKTGAMAVEPSIEELRVRFCD